MQRQIVGFGMRHQFFGDVNDYRKYALLRALAAGGTNRIGVCWMLTPDDGHHGGKIGYLDQPERYRHFDPDLFDILSAAWDAPDGRRLDVVERSGALPGGLYFNEPLPARPEARSAYMQACRDAFADTDLVFFDPDNGLETKGMVVGRKAASLYVFLDEVAAFYRTGQSVLIYQHYHRTGSRDEQVEGHLARLRSVAPDAELWTFRTSFVVFLLMLHPDSRPSLRQAVDAAASGFDPAFIAGQLVG